VNWLRLDQPAFDAWRERARESILEINDGIVSAAGIAEGFATAGATLRTLVLAGTTVVLAGGLAVAGARYSEVRTEWEMNRRLVEQERASIAADPMGELEELVGIYQAKGLSAELAQQVARALTDRDPVAAHADAELRLDELGPSSGAVPAAVTAGLSYGFGAALPLVAIYLLPLSNRVPLTFVTVLVALALTGWFAALLTNLPVLRLMGRNVVLGVVTMSLSLVVGHVLHL
jgi:VIT1/CCC1 family predicted Fe2+/Mn2+ transporter